MTAILLLIGLLLLLLNAFFVLAEFALVKVRPTRIEELTAQGHVRAKVVGHIQGHMDEYLAVCQVGITFASIGLGFVGEPAFAQLLLPALGWAGVASEVVAHGIAISAAYALVSSLHIILGEQVPKSMAIRTSERWAIATAKPLRVFRFLFWPPLVVLNGLTALVLRALRMPAASHDEVHSEEELRIILERCQTGGLMPFRRLLLMENLFDLGDLKVRHAMKPRAELRVLRASAPWEQSFRTIRESKLSRFALTDGNEDRPLGFIHVKDLLYAAQASAPGAAGPEGPPPAPDLRKLARPFHVTTEETAVETLLADLQRHRAHIAIVHDEAARWTGQITMEDIIEEIIGTIEDEFEIEPRVHLSDALTSERVVLGIRASTPREAIRLVLERLPRGALPIAVAKLEDAVLRREEALSTYMGHGYAAPHARVEGLDRPVLVLGRSEEGISLRGRAEKAHLLFILLTPAHHAVVQATLLARIAGIMESEYVETRLREASSVQEVLEAVRAGEAAALG